MAAVVCLRDMSQEPTTVEVDEAFFGRLVRKRLLREVVLRYEANLRQGTHSTKTRGEVAFSKRKPWRQKGTGRARAGKFSSPLWRKGGIVFGPRPRDYSRDMPRRALREALRSAILGKLHDGELAMVERIELEAPSTRSAVALLRKIDSADSAVVVLPEESEVLFKSLRNLPRVDVVVARELTALCLLLRRKAVFVGDALERVKERLGEPSLSMAGTVADATLAEATATTVAAPPSTSAGGSTAGADGASSTDVGASSTDAGRG
ncbi:MAG: 50S ribosomal protein L4 [Planctomycetota bacterium]